MRRIYLLPGMGADHRMYSGPWTLLQNATSLDWPPYAGEKTISEMGRRILSEQQIPPGSALVGSSLGGMVACEIANELELGCLILIGSAQRREEISVFLSKLHPIIDLTPIEFIQRIAGKIPKEIMQMFSAAEPAFIRAMCKAVFDWDGLNRQRIMPIRIHGRNDHVIPLPQGVQHVLDGGHLLAISHAEKCVEIIKSAVGDNSSAF